METIDIIVIAAIFVCLVVSFFFSGSETALTAASAPLGCARAGDKRAAIVNHLMEKPERRSAILLGNNSPISPLPRRRRHPVIWFGELGIAYATLVMTAIIVIFTEVLPKTIAINHPERTSLQLARPIAAIVAFLGPITLAIEAIVRWVLRMVGFKLEATTNVLTGSEELRGAVDVLHKEGSVVREERDMFGGLLDLKDLVVSDVMIHRTNMVAIDVDSPPEQIVREVLAAPYTRIPLYRDNPQNIVGVIHAKDLLRELAAAGGDVSQIDIPSIAQAPWFVPDTTSLFDQLKAFLKRKTHFALVVDEYGG
jgi:Mg2+/Co2+ transporter CorB